MASSVATRGHAAGRPRSFNHVSCISFVACIASGIPAALGTEFSL